MFPTETPDPERGILPDGPGGWSGLASSVPTGGLRSVDTRQHITPGRVNQAYPEALRRLRDRLGESIYQELIEERQIDEADQHRRTVPQDRIDELALISVLYEEAMEKSPESPRVVVAKGFGTTSQWIRDQLVQAASLGLRTSGQPGRQGGHLTRSGLQVSAALWDNNRLTDRGQKAADRINRKGSRQ